MNKKIFEWVGKCGFYIPIFLTIGLNIINLWLHNRLITYISEGLGWVIIWNASSYYIFLLIYKLKENRRKK